MTAIALPLNDILKEDYGPDGIGNLAYKKNPGFGMIKKHRLSGRYYMFPVQYGYASNRSHTGATALAKTNTTNFAHFEVPTIEDYDAKSLQKKAMEEAQEPGSFIDLLRNIADSVIQSLANNNGADFFNQRGAAIGQVSSSSIVASATIGVIDPGDITKFYVGQTIYGSATTGLTGAATASAVIDTIDRSASTIHTAGGNWSTQIAGLIPGWYLFPSGDFGLGRAGLADWCPDSVIGLSTAFYAATRSTDASRLAGSRFSVTGLPVSQAIRQVATIIGREEGEPDTVFTSFTTLNDLMTERDIKLTHVRKESEGMEATVGFNGVKIHGVTGELDVVPDRSCGDGRFYVVNMERGLCIHSMDAPVKIDDADGSIMIRESSTFTYDIRGASFSNFVWSRPVDNGVGIF
jgi:hypothetical protein